MRWFTAIESNCTVTSTWTNNEDNQNREFHMWWAYIMGPKDIRSTTWYLNQVKRRTWHHFPVITRIEGREFNTRKCVKSWAGWTPVSDAEKAKFQVLCPRNDHKEAALRDADNGEELVIPHEWLVSVAAEGKATTTSNRNKFCVLDENRPIL